MAMRKIIHIDEEKCNGCGECVPSCAEGAIQIIDGKAKLVSEVYCDGLGACLGHCAQDAITIIEREAADFDEGEANQHVAKLGTKNGSAAAACPSATGISGCPGSAARSLPLNVLPSNYATKGATAAQPSTVPPSAAQPTIGDGEGSMLGNWPVQLHLVPPNAPFLKDADLLLTADCVPFALADFHRRFLRGRPVLIGCPKLDDGQAYIEKLAAIIITSSARSLTVVHMEVPCCKGLARIAEAAIKLSGREIQLELATISIRGEVLG